MRVLRKPVHWIVLTAVIIAAAVMLFPPSGLEPVQARALAIVIVSLCLWGTGALPGHLTAMLFFLAAMLFDVAPPTIVFSGFASTAMWLTVGGLVIGMALRSSGLGDSIAAILGRRLDRSYAAMIWGLLLACTLLGLIMPSSLGRAVMMVPIAMALADRCGLASGSTGRTGVALAVAIGCHVPGFAILPSNVPNMVLIGAADTIYDIPLNYTDYLALHFPLLGLVKTVIVGFLILQLFPARLETIPTATIHEGTPDRRKQGILGVVLAVALGLWLTDSLHGISPAWVGLGAACILLLPPLGLVTGPIFAKEMNVSMLFFVAGALGIGAIVRSTGLGTVVATGIESWLPLEPGNDLVNFLSLSGMAFVTGLGATLPGIPAILSPMAGDLSAQTGLSVYAVLMTQVIGFSTILFPYQSPPLMVGMQLADEPVQKLLRITVPLTAITLLVLIPLDYLWWRMLGMFAG